MTDRPLKSRLLHFSPDIRSPKGRAFGDSAAYETYDAYKAIHDFGYQTIKYAEANDLDIIVLAGRPYHVDPEVHHGMDKLITSLSLAVISECLKSRCRQTTFYRSKSTTITVLYAAARYIADKDHMHLVQLVSFGCGLDAVTTDEVRSILENEGKIYTQIKIDEINNLGAARIRIRSLLAAIDQLKERKIK